MLADATASGVAPLPALSANLRVASTRSRAGRHRYLSNCFLVASLPISSVSSGLMGMR